MKAATVAAIAAAMSMALAASGCGGDAGAASPPDAATVQLVVQLARHDERGVVIANQASAQSGDPALRAAATELAEAQQRRADLLEAVLDEWDVPTADRRELDRIDVPDAAESAALASCTLIKDPDAVSRLANTPASRFDTAFRRLADVQRASGQQLAAEIAATGALTADDVARLTDLSDGLGSPASA